MPPLQNKLARILLHADIRTSVNKMMEDLNWKTLDVRWKNHVIIMTFKCLQEFAPSYMSSYFTFTRSAHDKNTRSQLGNILIVPPWYNSAGKRAFKYRAASLWNGLPVDIRTNFLNMSLNDFKSALNTYM